MLITENGEIPRVVPVIWEPRVQSAQPKYSSLSSNRNSAETVHTYENFAWLEIPDSMKFWEELKISIPCETAQRYRDSMSCECQGVPN